MAEHTPTPWEVGSHNRRGILKDAAGIADGCDAYMVAVTSAHSLVSPDEAAANAAFICKAVNNYDAMVAALENIKQLSDCKLSRQMAADVLAGIDVGGAGQ